MDAELRHAKDCKINLREGEKVNPDLGFTIAGTVAAVGSRGLRRGCGGLQRRAAAGREEEDGARAARGGDGRHELGPSGAGYGLGGPRRWEVAGVPRVAS